MKELKRIHFIAIGGSAMHNLAIALHKKGYKISGSDDEIVEPSRSRLLAHQLLPAQEGWYPEQINSSIDAIILGMHARANNPELLRAKELGMKVYSYPEFLYEQSIDKTRVVIGGSHGKTTITSMVMHVLSACNIDFDYMVGAQLAGFDTMVKITRDAKIMVLEGDEYLASPIDPRPKFHFYKANIALISGIAWDHINVFPTIEDYIRQFDLFIDTIQDKGTLIYCSEDKALEELVRKKLRRISSKDFETTYDSRELKTIPYQTPDHQVENGTTHLLTTYGEVPLQIFGGHNLQNLAGARLVCNQLGISDEKFFEAIRTFKGAAKRLEIAEQNDETIIFKDFAHSPSKLKATTAAVKNQYPLRELVACMELHTFSSLNKKFMQEYKGAMNNADIPIVYFNPKTILHKKLEPITEEVVRDSFENDRLKVFTDSEKMISYLQSLNWKNKNLLMMSSGNFDGVNLEGFSKTILHKS